MGYSKPSAKKMDAKMSVSFVIPALNEAAHIGTTIGSIHARMAGIGEYEVIVVDHGSSDATVDVAAAAGARVLSRPFAHTIAALRNEGATEAQGAILTFVDADVTLTKEWGNHFPAVLRLVLNEPKRITGSLCTPPANGSWLERYWFGSVRTATHVGTGHMIVNRAYFLFLGGFRKDLETGEDYEFCERVRRDDGSVVIEPKLRVIHNGYPKNLLEFMRREAWHGRGDLKAISHYLRSKVALAATAFLLLHVIIIAGAFGQKPLALISGAAGLVAVLALSSVVRYAGASPGSIVINGLIFYFYYLGRCLSFTYLLRSSPGGAATRCETNEP